MIAPARVAAYSMLEAVASGRADLSGAVASERATLADDRDRALAMEIATGTERWRATLDHVIEHFARRRVDQLDLEILVILRLSLYQLLHLTRVPSSAVVDDGVELSRRAGKRSASGLINAVLRGVLRARAPLPLPSRPSDPLQRDRAVDYLSVALSHPRWLAARWYDRLGLDVAESWMRFNNTPAPLTLRTNPLRSSRDTLRERLRGAGVETAVGRFGPDTLIVSSGRPTGDDFVIQDEASQLVTLLAGPSPGPAVLDTCAAPGGKATALAAAMATRADRHLLVACDVREPRIQLLRRTIAATGADGTRVVQTDLREPLPFTRSFDCVFVDAPCSGLGTLRRDPDIKWKRQPADLAVFATEQLRMLTHAAAVLKTGGRIVYATCSSEPEENEQVVDRFLESATDVAPFDARAAHPQLSAALVDARGHFRTEPGAHGLECFFGAVMTRKL